MHAVTRRCLRALAPCPLLVGLIACGPSGTPTQSASSLVTQGLEAQLSGDTATAETDYKQAIQLDAKNKYAHYDLGTVYEKQGDRTLALQEYQSALAIDPNFTDALFNTAVDTAASNPPGAEQLYRKVLSLQPTWAAAWLNLGFVLQSEGRPSEAATDWAKATSLDSSLASRIPNPLSGATPSVTVPSPTPAH